MSASTNSKERLLAMLDMARDGHTDVEIARVYGITKERVGQYMRPFRILGMAPARPFGRPPNPKTAEILRQHADGVAIKEIARNVKQTYERVRATIIRSKNHEPYK